MEALGLLAALLGLVWLLLPVWSALNASAMRRRIALLEVETSELREAGAKLWEEVEALRKEVRRGVKVEGAPRAMATPAVMSAQATVRPAEAGSAPADGAARAADAARVLAAAHAEADEEPTRLGQAAFSAQAADDEPTRVSAVAPELVAAARREAAVGAAASGSAAVGAVARSVEGAAAAPSAPTVEAAVDAASAARGAERADGAKAGWFEASRSVEELPIEARPPSGTWTFWETHVVGNWTGILGALAVVLGVGFLGIYAALSLSPGGRFGLVVLAAVGLVALSSLLGRRAEWTALSLWVRSAAGAVLLIGCVASVLFTPMRWVESETVGLLLVVGGVAVNLGLGLLAGGQAFAAVHVVLSLIALGMLPASATTLVLAATVALAGELVVLRHPRWGVQLAASAGTFTIWHLLWVVQTHVPDASWSAHAVPVVCALLVGAAGFVTSYRRILDLPEFKLSTWALHLSIQAMLGVSLLAHDLGGWAGVVGMAAASVALHRSSAFARERGVAWLSTTDRLVSLGLMTGAAGMLWRHGVEGPTLVVALTLPSLVWLALELRRDVALLVDVPLAGAHLGGLVLATVCLAADGGWERLRLLGVVVVAYAVLSAWGEDRRRAGGVATQAEERTLGLGLTLGLLVLVLNVNVWARDELWAALAPAGALAALVAYRRAAPSAALEAGVLLVLVHFATQGLIHVGLREAWDAPLAVAQLVVPLLLVGAPARSTGAVARAFPLVVLAVALCVVSWRFLVDASAFLPGVAWVLLSVAWLEVSRLERAAPAAGFLRALGAATFAAFVVRHGLVDLQNEARVGPISVRGAVELYAAGAAAWWVAATARAPSAPFGWFLEAALGLVALFVAFEVPAAWIAPVLALWALALIEAGARLPSLGRLVGWGAVLHLVALVRVAVLSARLVSPLAESSVAWFASLGALGVGVALFLRARALGPMERPPHPGGLGAVAALAVGGRQRPGPWLLYPWFLALALFLAWTFSHGVLTLLWMMECFGVFVAAIALRDEALRRMAMVAIVVVLGRLLLYDLAGSDVLVKAMVFLGSGGLLIGINALYHRFRERFGEA
jgi:hypothetical protein